MLLDSNFWRGRRVLLTGHTGFKGSWASVLLNQLGASVVGLALEPEGETNLFSAANVETDVEHHVVDIRDAKAVHDVVEKAKPEVVIHMAAQALVRRSYRDPAGTFATNVQGTANLLDAIRACPATRTTLIVTSDKVYENNEEGRAFTEDDKLGGHDPYSASKAAAEIVAKSYRESYFRDLNKNLVTVRGGNVIGGGDFSEDRIVPDIWRAISKGEPVALRNPGSVRPWQHVLDCLHGYLAYVQAIETKEAIPTALNIGPSAQEPVSVKALTETFFRAIDAEPNIEYETEEQPPEKMLLAINPALAQSSLGWRDLFSTREAVEWTASWYGGFSQGTAARDLVVDQIERFMRKA